jgi:hypothetical protein
MVALENLAKQLIFRALPAEVTTQFLDRLPHRESDFFNLSKREVIRLRDNADVGSCFTLEHDKKGQIVRDFYDRNIALTSAYRQLNCEHDSRSYQIGRLVTAPVRHVKRWWLRSTEFWQTDPSGNQARKPVTGKREQAK